MTECEDLPFLNGGDVMMLNNDAFSRSVLYGGDIKDDDSDGLSFSTNVQDDPCPLDWNVDSMAGYENDNLSDLFNPELFDGAFGDDSPNLESILGESFSKLDSPVTPQTFDFPSSDVSNGLIQGFDSPNRGTKRQISGIEEEVLNASDSALFNEFLAEKNTFKQCRTNEVTTSATSAQHCSTSSSSVFYDDFIPTISLADLMSPKEEVDCPSLSSTTSSATTTTSAGVVVGGIAGVSTFGGLVCKPETSSSSSSPPYSGVSEYWDSGLSTGEVSPTRGSNLDQQLSPLSDYTDSSSSSSSSSSSGGSPEYQLSLSSPPGHSSTSGYSSSSSPSSSPSNSTSRGSSRSPPSGRGVRAPVTTSPTAVGVGAPTPVKFTVNNNNNNNAGSNASTVTPQFYIHKKTSGNKFTLNNGSNINYSNKGQQITLVSTNQTNSCYPSTITTRVTNSTKITPAIINRNQLNTSNTYNRSISTHNTSSNNTIKPSLSAFKSSPAPSIVTLSGVNKTAGIIKSPSVVNLNRKQTFSNINNIPNFSSSATTTIVSNSSTTSNNQPKSFSLVAASDIVSSTGSITSTSSSSSPLYKSVTVTNATGRITTNSGQQFIITPRGSVSGLAAGKFIKSSQNNSIYIPINTKDLDKVRTIKLITKSNQVTSSASKTGTPTFTTSSAGGTIVRAASSGSSSNGIHAIVSAPCRNRTFTTAGLTTSHSGTIRTSTPAGQVSNVSILKNLCLGSKGGLTSSNSGGFASLLTIPKEEDYDSEDEGIELPQNGSPLTLTEEEQKLAQKESLKFPSHYPLTKKQERDLKRIRRKIRNKISAQDSRKRKKEYMDKLEERVTATTRDNDRLRVQVARLEETNKKLTEQLEKFQNMMNSQPAPSVASNNTSGHSSNSSSSHSRQHHPSTFLLMMLMSAALFVYPSVVPQVKSGTDLLTAVPHKMPPAGNSRSLLEAAATKLAVCHDDAHEDELDLEIKPSIAALNDHDYTPPAKRLRYDFGGVTRDGYCMPLLDDHLPPAPPPTQKGGSPGGGGGGGGGGEEDDKGGVWRVDEKGGGGGDGNSFGGSVVKKKSGADDDPAVEKIEVEALEEIVKVEKEVTLNTSKPGNQFFTSAAVGPPSPSLKVDPDLASRFTKEVLESVMSQLGGSGNQNWTLENDGEAKKNAAVFSAALDSLSQSLVVELAAAAAGRKRLREDIELE